MDISNIVQYIKIYAFGNYTTQTTKKEIKKILLNTLKCTLNLFDMANKIQFEHLLKYKKEQRKLNKTIKNKLNKK